MKCWVTFLFYWVCFAGRFFGSGRGTFLYFDYHFQLFVELLCIDADFFSLLMFLMKMRVFMASKNPITRISFSPTMVTSNFNNYWIFFLTVKNGADVPCILGFYCFVFQNPHISSFYLSFSSFHLQKCLILSIYLFLPQNWHCPETEISDLNAFKYFLCSQWETPLFVFTFHLFSYI